MCECVEFITVALVYIDSFNHRLFEVCCVCILSSLALYVCLVSIRCYSKINRKIVFNFTFFIFVLKEVVSSYYGAEINAYVLECDELCMHPS
jgi:hypothetical protein